MPDIVNDRVNPVTIQNFIRDLEFPEFEVANDFFPEELIDGIEFRYNTTQLSRPPAVEYRSWDAEAKIGKRQGVTRATQELPPLAEKIPLTEEQYIRYRAATTDNWTPYIKQIFDDLANLVEGVFTQWELGAGSLLSTGTITLPAQNGSWTETLTYPVPGGNFITPATPWTTLATADPLSDLIAGVAQFRLANRNQVPGVMLISEKIAGLLVRNVAIQNTLYNGNPNGGPSVVSREAVNAYLQAHGLPRFRIIRSQATRADGTIVDVIPDNKVVLLSGRGPIGRTVKGVTGTALGLVDKKVFTIDEAPGIVGLSWDESDPARRWNMVDACGMPVLADANGLVVLTVAA